MIAVECFSILFYSRLSASAVSDHVSQGLNEDTVEEYRKYNYSNDAKYSNSDVLTGLYQPIRASNVQLQVEPL